ncbi:hypothetical protein CYG49_03150 [Candidatus Saccharibacteria bacterium]|nr:MAG: hypothetical protein CYG49_03150 [Candidatus Saccharibacteria bacterium]
MARLPTPGGDDDVWGNVLNDYLSVGHGADGAHNYATFAQNMLGSGVLTSRPAPDATNNGKYFFVTDVDGGTLYQSNGTAWTQLTRGINAAPAAHTHNLSTLADVTVSSPAANQVLTYDGSKWINSSAASAPSNMMTTDTDQTVTSVKTFDRAPVAKNLTIINPVSTASASLYLHNTTASKIWEFFSDLNGDFGAWDVTRNQTGFRIGADVPNNAMVLNATRATFAGEVWEGTNRVYSPANKPTPADIGAVANTAIGVASGIASLDAATKVPVAQIPTGTTNTTVALGDHTHSAATASAYTFTLQGTLYVTGGKTRIYMERAGAIQGVRASVSTPPAGSGVIVDVNIDGATIYTDQTLRPTIADAAHTSGFITSVKPAVAAGQFITVDVDQVGATTAGADLSVTVWVL